MDNTVEKQDKPDEKYFDEGGKGTIKDKDANQKDTKYKLLTFYPDCVKTNTYFLYISTLIITLPTFNYSIL